MIEQLRRTEWDWIIGLLLTLVGLLVFVATLTPSLSYKSPDGNELATVPYILGLAHATGYPLYTWLGKLFTYLPVGDVAHRMNLMSAILGSVSVGLLYFILVELLSSPDSSSRGQGWIRPAAAFSSLIFSFSRTFWSQTGIAEVYAPNLFMISLMLLILLRWARVEEQSRSTRQSGFVSWRSFVPSFCSLALLFLVALVLGLSLGTHMSNLGFIPGIALFILLSSWQTALSPLVWVVGLGGFGLGVLQFLWLPFKAATLNDRVMLGNAPRTLQSIYAYTLGAFPQLKFAFGWTQVPDRIVIYQAFLVQQFALPGVLLGLLGMWVLLFRKPRRFFLLMGLYLVHVVFFSQYAAFDLDVFFIPAHFIFAIFIGFGIWQLLEWGSIAIRWTVDRVGGRPGAHKLIRIIMLCLVAVGLAGSVLCQLGRNWAQNDYSDDVAINDFYENVFALLPLDSILLGRTGVFGYDMFYYRLVYQLRPDVSMPHLSTPDPDIVMDGRAVYTTERIGELNHQNPWTLRANIFSPESWTYPFLIASTPEEHGISGRRAELILWKVSDSPPQLIVPIGEAAISERVDLEIGGKTLVGYTLNQSEIRAGEAIFLELYWKMERPNDLWTSLGIGQDEIIAYEIGFGNLVRLANERQILWNDSKEWLVADNFWLVISRTTPVGTIDLSLGAGLAPRVLVDEAQLENQIVFTSIEVVEPIPMLNWE